MEKSIEKEKNSSLHEKKYTIEELLRLGKESNEMEFAERKLQKENNG